MEKIKKKNNHLDFTAQFTETILVVSYSFVGVSYDTGEILVQWKLTLSSILCTMVIKIS